MTTDSNDKAKSENQQITSRNDGYSEWYLDVIAAAELAENAPVRGCMIIRPYGYALWERIQKIIDAELKKTGVQNVYFPLLIPESLLKREEAHVEGFAPEVAVVTHAGGKKLEEPYIIRPTSETIMYETFGRWIQSYRDLPLLLNQWANVVRWEMRPRLFLRTTEFLWQEGHTVHETEREADDRARQMLELYRAFAEDIMAIPVIPGVKSESERFAGALYTYTIEAMMQDGKALQFATSHNLGQNFAKVFDVSFTGRDSEMQYAWQTSWGLSTRTIGGLIMVHSDDKGLVLPPRMAPIQVVLTTIGHGDSAAGVEAKARTIAAELEREGVRTYVDATEARPGEKFYTWERKGVPLRIEIGPKDIESHSVVLARRDTGDKQTESLGNLTATITAMLESIQSDLYEKALNLRTSRTVEAEDWESFKTSIEAGNFVSAYWCEDTEIEKNIKTETGATVRCIPFDQQSSEGKCAYSGRPSSRKAIFAKAY